MGDSGNWPELTFGHIGWLVRVEFSKCLERFDRRKKES